MSAPDFEAAVLPHRSRLYGRAMKLTRDHDDAADLVQDTMLRAFRFWGTFDGAHVKAWLFTILQNTFRTSYGRRARHQSTIMSLGDAHKYGEEVSSAGLGHRSHCPESEYISQFDRALVGAAIDDLPPDQMIVVWLVDINYVSYKQAAEELACPMGTIMSRLHRARIALRALIEDRLDEDLAA